MRLDKKKSLCCLKHNERVSLTANNLYNPLQFDSFTTTCERGVGRTVYARIIIKMLAKDAWKRRNQNQGHRHHLLILMLSIQRDVTNAKSLDMTILLVPIM